MLHSRRDASGGWGLVSSNQSNRNEATV